jgi:uncharacterized membrane protein
VKKIHPISHSELWAAQTALAVAMLLQIFIWILNRQLTYGPHNLIVATEAALAIVIGLSATHRHKLNSGIYRTISFLLLGLISLANISSFVLVLRLLINNGPVSGRQLIVAAMAIFLTNIIVFALWYWEIDSPGLTGHRWSRHDKDFQFTQHELVHDFPDWQPTFTDYLYLSVTNAINFAPADTKPLTAQAKGLMGIQALISVFTLALVLARSVSILH